MTRIKEVKVLPYDPSWPEKFEIEALLIKDVLKDKYIAVHHIGSTSVPGLCAKEELDMMLVVRDLKDALTLQSHGYTFKGEFNIPLRYFFSKNTDFSKVNLHVVEVGHGFIDLQLKFRDYLRSHPEASQEYSELKLNLVKDPSNFIKQEGRFVNYSLKKNEFIKSILRSSGYDKLIVNFCMHDQEFEAFHRIRKQVLFEPAGINYDPSHPTMKDPNYHHMVLYKGVDIIGVADVQFLEKENEAALRPFAILPELQRKGLGKWFLAFIEKWVKSKGKTVLKMHASLKAEHFYRKLGYSEMEFQDETPFKDIVDLGKVLF